MHHQRAARLALHQALAVVQPRVVAAHVAPADQRQRRHGLGERRRGPCEVATNRAGASRCRRFGVARRRGKRSLRAPRGPRRSAHRAASAKSGPRAGDRARACSLRKRAEPRQRAEQLHPARVRHAVAPRLEHPVERAVRAEAPRDRIPSPCRDTRAGTDAAPCARDARSRARISWSCSAPAGFGNSGGEYLATLRTAKPLSAMS